MSLSGAGALAGFISLAPTDTTWQVYYEREIFCRPGLPLHGRHPVALKVVAGFVDWSSMLEQGGHPFSTAVDKCLGTSCASVLDSLLALHDHGKVMDPLLSQLIWHVGSGIEAALLDSPLPADLEHTSGVGAPGSKQMGVRYAKACAVSFRDRAGKNAKAAVAEYFLAAGAAFYPLGSLCLAVDAARVGNRGCFLGLATKTDNSCCRLPPQVPTQQSPTQRETVLDQV